MGREFELKYRADSASIARIREKYGDFTAISMETVYYDTPDLALSRRRWTLRRRYENGTAVCTLKTPAGGFSRNELELECDDLSCAIDYFCENGAPEDFRQLIAEGLIAVCGAKFHRTAISVELENASVELALDSGILTGGQKSIPLCEVEVELKSGTKESANFFAAQLACKHRLALETKSKFRRALTLYQEGESV